MAGKTSLFSLLRPKEENDTLLENYFTKILAYLFEKSPKILYAWLRDIDLTNDMNQYTKVKVSRQKFLTRLSDDHENAIPDIQIELQDNMSWDLMFVEAKIKNPANIYQLRKYSKQLDAAVGFRDKTLLFVTLRDIPKFQREQVIESNPNSTVRFQQVTWNTLYQTLQAQSKDTLVDEIIILMYEWGMGQSYKLTEDHRINLSGVDLSRAGLQGVELSKSNLQGTNLSSANLSRANLCEANLQDANLSNAKLIGADLTGTNLCRANLGRANLRGANLSRTNLSESNLTGVDLQGVNFSEANLSGANLRGVSLQQVNLRGIKIDTNTQIDPKWRVVCELHNQKCPPVGADLAGLDLQGIKMAHYHLPEINLSESNLNGADLRFANITEGNLSKVKLVGADLRGTDLHDSDISGAILAGTDLRGANLNGANLMGAKYDSQTQWPDGFIPGEDLYLVDLG